MIVTVVTPTFNAAEYLRECIASTRANQTSDIEIDHVVVDGGSTDGTVALARACGARVMVGKDKGIFDAINKGSFNSEGELLGFLGADDVMLPGGMQAVVDTYHRSGRRWVSGGIRWIDEKGRGLGALAAPPSWMSARTLACLGWNPVMHMGTYFSREFFVELGGFDISFRDSADYEMFSRARAITPYARIARPVACFRRTGANNSAVNGERTRRENLAVLERFGPRSRLEQQATRYALKAWFNAANPAWCATKLAEPLRLGLGLQRHAYF